MVPIEVASGGGLSGNPGGLSVFSPLNLKLSNLEVRTSSSIAGKVLPVDIDGSAANVIIGSGRGGHSSRAANDSLSSGVLGRELVGSAMLVETTNHNLDELSLLEASQALDGSSGVSRCVEHGDSALAVLDDIGLLSEAVLLELDPSAVVLVEYDLVTENGGILSGCRLFPSDFNVSADKLDGSHLDSSGTGSGGKSEYLREVSISTDVSSADSESVL